MFSNTQRFTREIFLDNFLCNGYSHAQPSDDSDKLITPEDSKTTRVRSQTALHGVICVDHQQFSLETLHKFLYTPDSAAPQQVLIFIDIAQRVGIVVDIPAQLGIIAAHCMVDKEVKRGTELR